MISSVLLILVVKQSAEKNYFTVFDVRHVKPVFLELLSIYFIL